MRPRFGAHEAYSSYQPETYAEAEFPSNRKFFFFSPTQERMGLCSIANIIQRRAIPAIHMATKRRQAPPPPQQGAPPAPPQHSLKQWATLTNDTDAVLGGMVASNKSVTAARIAECRARVGIDESSRERLALMTGQTQQSHLTDYLSACIYGGGGSACSAVGPELLRDSFMLMSRRGYARPVAIGAAASADAAAEDGGAAEEAAGGGGTVRATHMSMLNPLLDPTMSCPALNNMLPAELRIFRAPTSSREVFEAADGPEGVAGDDGAEVAGRGCHKASSSSSFLFSRNTKVFRIRAAKADRMEKPVRRGATVTMGGRVVPSQGGALVGSAVVEKATRGAGRGRKAAGGGEADDEDVLLTTRYGTIAGSNAVINAEVDEFALVDPIVGAKRGREEGGPVDDGGDGVESNGDADTNSLSSFSGDDDDDMSESGGSGDELYL